MNNTRLGAWGEDKAADFLQKHACRILERNYHTRFGEIDIIAQQREILLFVEVKLRKNSFFAAAAEAVTPAKQKRIILAAQDWLAANREREAQTARFDVIEIYAPYGADRDYRLNWIPNAFEVI